MACSQGPSDSFHQRVPTEGGRACTACPPSGSQWSLELLWPPHLALKTQVPPTDSMGGAAQVPGLLGQARVTRAGQRCQVERIRGWAATVQGPLWPWVPSSPPAWAADCGGNAPPPSAHPPSSVGSGRGCAWGQGRLVDCKQEAGGSQGRWGVGLVLAPGQEPVSQRPGSQVPGGRGALPRGVPCALGLPLWLPPICTSHPLASSLLLCL